MNGFQTYATVHLVNCTPLGLQKNYTLYKFTWKYILGILCKSLNMKQYFWNIILMLETIQLAVATGSSFMLTQPVVCALPLLKKASLVAERLAHANRSTFRAHWWPWSSARLSPRTPFTSWKSDLIRSLNSWRPICRSRTWPKLAINSYIRKLPTWGNGRLEAHRRTPRRHGR